MNIYIYMQAEVDSCKSSSKKYWSEAKGRFLSSGFTRLYQAAQYQVRERLACQESCAWGIPYLHLDAWDIWGENKYIIVEREAYVLMAIDMCPIGRMMESLSCGQYSINVNRRRF